MSRGEQTLLHLYVEMLFAQRYLWISYDLFASNSGLPFQAPFFLVSVATIVVRVSEIVTQLMHPKYSQLV